MEETSAIPQDLVCPLHTAAQDLKRYQYVQSSAHWVVFSGRARPRKGECSKPSCRLTRDSGIALISGTRYHQHEQHELGAGSWARKRPPGAFASHALVLTSLLTPSAAAAVHFVLPRYYIPASFRLSLTYSLGGGSSSWGAAPYTKNRTKFPLKSYLLKLHFFLSPELTEGDNEKNEGTRKLEL